MEQMILFKSLRREGRLARRPVRKVKPRKQGQGYRMGHDQGTSLGWVL